MPEQINQQLSLIPELVPVQSNYVKRNLGPEWRCKLCGYKCKNNRGVGMHARIHGIRGQNAGTRLKMHVQSHPEEWLPEFRDVENTEEISFISNIPRSRLVEPHADVTRPITRVSLQEVTIECSTCGAKMRMLIQ